MGSKKKISRVFGQGLGRHRNIRKCKHKGRPIYQIKKQRNSKTPKLKLTLSRIHRVYRSLNTASQQKQNRPLDLYTVYPSSDLKLKIRKVKNVSPKGYRIINLDCLQQHVSDITIHMCLCKEAIQIASQGRSPIVLQNEVNNFGLASVMMAQCQGCLHKFKVNTSPKIPGSKRFDINVRAVWGSMVTGNGPAHLNEFMGTINAPGLSQPTFSAIEDDIGKWWHAVLEQEILFAGQEERRLAIERNDFHQEFPAITVITDGGWSKRTHKHSYNAAGGVAIIIGKETKKLLHIGVRNKYCYICNSQNNTPHTCFKNWFQDSQSMESDIILDGFLKAENKHGLRFMRIIGDGDSSVFARIREEVPVWGRFVTKEECANHVCKCYRSKLENLVSDNPLYKGKHHLTKATRVRLVSALRCAIRVRSEEYFGKKCNKSSAIQKLSHDIKNSVHHVFGKHSNCSDFCNAKTQPPNQSDSTVPETSSPQSSSSTHNSDVQNMVIDEQIGFWTEGSSISEQEESRNPTSIMYSNVEQHIIKDVTSLLLKIAEKSDRLINNSTTNLAESWMHMRTKFDGGKVHNLCNRGSWHARCYGGALRMNLGPQWSCSVWQSCTASEPGYFFRKLYARREQTLKNATKYRQKTETRQLRWRKKMLSVKSNTTKKARKAYGPDALDVTEDVSPVDLKTLQDSFLEKHINISSQQCKTISDSTVLQSQSGLWYSERQKRITTSNFGSIIKRNPSLSIEKFVRNILYSSFHGNRHTRNGILQEDTTIEEYKLKKAEERENVNVNKSGLIIHPDHKYLAGSPDGIVTTSTGDSGLIEIKNLLHSKPINLWQASENPSFCLQNFNGKLQLKQNHNYFFQCHGLLNICGKKWIDFVVRTLNPHQIFIQRIQQDDTIWTNMLPKLQAFYHNVLLPELASPREGKCPGIREPGIWYMPPTVKKQQKRQTTRNLKGQRRTSKPYSSSDSESACIESQGHAEAYNRNTRKRPAKPKFLGRCINHEWVVDENSNQKEWYKGTVLCVLSGADGDLNAVYEVLYEGDDDAYEIDHLIQDYQAGSVQFCDI